MEIPERIGHDKKAAAPPAWHVIAAAVKGRRHERTGQPCQDAVGWEAVSGLVLIAAVADGAGSARLSDVGSAVAVAAAITTLRGALGLLAENHPESAPASAKAGVIPDSAAVPFFKDDAALKRALKAALEAAQKAVVGEAKARQVQPTDLATTLLVCAAAPNGVAAAQIGDGAVVFGSGADELRALTRPAAGEYLNETVFLTSEAALDQAQVATWPGRVNQLALFSDGLQMLALKMPEGTPHGPFFKPLFAWLTKAGALEAAKTELEAWLRSARLGERTDDDLTLLLAQFAGATA